MAIVFNHSTVHFKIQYSPRIKLTETTKKDCTCCNATPNKETENSHYDCNDHMNSSDDRDSTLRPRRNSSTPTTNSSDQNYNCMSGESYELELSDKIYRNSSNTQDKSTQTENDMKSWLFEKKFDDLHESKVDNNYQPNGNDKQTVLDNVTEAKGTSIITDINSPFNHHYSVISKGQIASKFDPSSDRLDKIYVSENNKVPKTTAKSYADVLKRTTTPALNELDNDPLTSKHATTSLENDLNKEPQFHHQLEIDPVKCNRKEFSAYNINDTEDGMKSLEGSYKDDLHLWLMPHRSIITDDYHYVQLEKAQQVTPKFDPSDSKMWLQARSSHNKVSQKIGNKNLEMCLNFEQDNCSDEARKQETEINANFRPSSASFSGRLKWISNSERQSNASRNHKSFDCLSANDFSPKTCNEHLARKNPKDKWKQGTKRPAPDLKVWLQRKY